MGLADDIAEIGGLIDAYDDGRPACHVIVDSPGRERPPIEMRGGPFGGDWVACLVLPSTLQVADVEALENEFDIALPPVIRAYPLARFHLHDQVRSHKHGNLISWPCVPSRRSLDPLREYLRGWPALLKAGYIPFASWGDGWGPMCFDAARRQPDDDCPVVWLDHELLFDAGIEKISDRAVSEPLARPLYDSARELIRDVFTIPAN